MKGIKEGSGGGGETPFIHIGQHPKQKKEGGVLKRKGSA